MLHQLEAIGYGTCVHEQRHTNAQTRTFNFLWVLHDIVLKLIPDNNLNTWL